MEFIYEFNMGALEHLKSEWHVVRGAPVAVLIFIVTGFGLGLLFMRQEVANAQSEVRLKDTEIGQLKGERDDYRKQVEERFQKIEQQLSSAQQSKLMDLLKSSPSNVEIFSDPTVPLSGQITDVFTKSGWQVNTTETAKDSVVLRAIDPKSQAAIGTALRDAGVKFDLSAPASGGMSAVDFILFWEVGKTPDSPKTNG
ncbi:hypothetical protein ACFFTN_21060 [Aminobacter aganoensis]|uniref:Uncharacterized protein n=1 Tax=Aminobacter aganoensis TaxID=83264 RepID=A0A7X0FC03_9HYPH|nr:hypothetical protein [Aminobacter aganoensis]MBB6356942.1 hypothetical protein [Aminobacter aganoensis]